MSVAFPGWRCSNGFSMGSLTGTRWELVTEVFGQTAYLEADKLLGARSLCPQIQRTFDSSKAPTHVHARRRMFVVARVLTNKDSCAS